MHNKWWSVLLPVLYVAWAFYVLDIPDMPNPHAADIGFLGLWAFRSLNLVGGVLFVAVFQICWHAHVWFFSPQFQQASTGEFVALVGVILLTGVVQWLGIGVLLARLYRAIQRSRPAVP